MARMNYILEDKQFWFWIILLCGIWADAVQMFVREITHCRLKWRHPRIEEGLQPHTTTNWRRIWCFPHFGPNFLVRSSCESKPKIKFRALVQAAGGQWRQAGLPLKQTRNAPAEAQLVCTCGTWAMYTEYTVYIYIHTYIYIYILLYTVSTSGDFQLDTCQNLSDFLIRSG